VQGSALAILSQNLEAISINVIWAFLSVKLPRLEEGGGDKIKFCNSVVLQTPTELLFQLHTEGSTQLGEQTGRTDTNLQEGQQAPSTTTGVSPEPQAGMSAQSLATSATAHLRSGRVQDLQQPDVRWGFSPDAHSGVVAAH